MLKALEAELGVDKLTLSFSIEGRTEGGQKRTAFASVTVAKQDHRAVGWSTQEMHVVSCIMGKHVVMATFRDAVVRRIISPGESKELADIFSGYDRHLVKLVQKLTP